MTINVAVLINLKNQIFVDEVLSKTRVNGLEWALVSPGTYRVTMCEPTKCQSPSAPSTSWVISVVRNLSNVGPDNTYNYYLEVNQNNYPFITISSLDIQQVETLYKQIELLFT